MKKPLCLACILLSWGVFSLPRARAGAGTGGEENASGEMIRNNNLAINKRTKEITLKVRLALTEGILEYLLVGDYGKTYESVFKIDHNIPSDLHFALVLIGREPMEYGKYLDLKKQPDGAEILMKPEYAASLVKIALRREGKPVPMDDIIEKREALKEERIWVFTGGERGKNGGYLGDKSFSYIGVWHDHTAPLNLFSAGGNPYRGNLGYQIKADNQDLAAGREYELVLTPYENEAKRTAP